jgi:hypothetical protein
VIDGEHALAEPAMAHDDAEPMRLQSVVDRTLQRTRTVRNLDYDSHRTSIG